MWAEWRHASDGSVDPDDDVRWVCALDVDLAVLDLRDPTVHRALSVTPPELIAAWSPDAPNEATLRVAAVARELGVDAVIVPSAARDGGWNLAVLPTAFPQVHLASRRRRSAPARHTAP
jgi:RES domain-containing protein